MSDAGDPHDEDAVVLMAKAVAELWVASKSVCEYRLTLVVDPSSRVFRHIPYSMKKWRSGDSPFAGIPPIRDLRITTSENCIHMVTSQSPDDLKRLADWFISRDFEVYGLW